MAGSIHAWQPLTSNGWNAPEEMPEVGAKAGRDHWRQVQEDCQLFGSNSTLSLSGHHGDERLFHGFGVRLRIVWGANNMWRLTRAKSMASYDFAKGCAAQISPGGGSS